MSQLRTNSIVPVGGIPAGASGGGIIQIVSVTKTDDFSTSTNANGGVAVTGLSASITPRSSSNKILVQAGLCLNTLPGYSGGMSLYRGGTQIGTGVRTSDSSTPLQQKVSSFIYSNSNNPHIFGQLYVSFLDSPSTTSSTTYSVNVHNDGRSTAVTVGNTDTSNNTYIMKPLAYIILMEVSG